MGATDTGLARIAGILKAGREEFAAGLDRMDRIDWLRGLVAKREATCARLADEIFRASAQSRASQCVAERMQISARLKRLRAASILASAGLNRARALLHVAGARPLGGGYLDAVNRDEARFNAQAGRSGVVWAGD